MTEFGGRKWFGVISGLSGLCSERRPHVGLTEVAWGPSLCQGDELAPSRSGSAVMVRDPTWDHSFVQPWPRWSPACVGEDMPTLNLLQIIRATIGMSFPVGEFGLCPAVAVGAGWWSAKPATAAELASVGVDSIPFAWMTPVVSPKTGY